MEKVLWIVGLVLLVMNILVLGFGFLFKIMHWPFANEMILGGGAGVVFGVVLMVLGIALRKRPDDL